MLAWAVVLAGCQPAPRPAAATATVAVLRGTLPGFTTRTSPTVAPAAAVGVTPHPRPALSVGSAGFDTAACPPSNFGSRHCSAASPLAAMNCESIEPPDPLLGGLRPGLSLRVCYFRPAQGAATPTPEEYFYPRGCMLKLYARYILYDGETFSLLRSPQELRKTFAPVDSPDKALGFALAVTGFTALNDFKPLPDFRYLVNSLEETHVREDNGVYVVRLYEYRLCGCGPHTTYARDVRVTRDGQVQVGERQPVFEDPLQDQLCVD